MSRSIAVLRPEPGNRATAAAIAARGLTAIRLPLFEIVPVPWQMPAGEDFDALILTSANAMRHGGAHLAGLRHLPVFAVGEATARAARQAGFSVAATGEAGAATLIETAREHGVRRGLHLAGQARTVTVGDIVARIETVYASAPRPVSEHAVCGIAHAVALVQSARAGARLAMLAERAGLDRATVAIAAISEAAASGLGGGWQAIRVAPTPDSAQLLNTAFALAEWPLVDPFDVRGNKEP